MSFKDDILEKFKDIHPEISAENLETEFNSRLNEFKSAHPDLKGKVAMTAFLTDETVQNKEPPATEASISESSAAQSSAQESLSADNGTNPVIEERKQTSAKDAHKERREKKQSGSRPETRENAAPAPDKTDRETGYAPDPLEAAALKALHRKWRYYRTKKEFDDTVAECSKPIDGYKINEYEAARYNNLLELGDIEIKSTDDLTPELIQQAEKELRRNKELWSKIQAAHLWNSAGLGKEIPFDEKMPDAKTVLYTIKEKIDEMGKGSFVDGKYTPSEEEKKLLNALHNYGIYPHAREGKNFAEILKDSVTRIMRRDDYRIPLQSERRRTAKAASAKTQTGKKTLRTENTTSGKDKKMTEDMTYKFNDEDERIAGELGLKTSDYKTKDDFLKAVDKVLDGRSQVSAEAYLAEKEPELKDEKKPENAEAEVSAKEDLNFHTENKEPLPVAENVEEPDWVKRKAQWYEENKESLGLVDYNRDTSNSQEFRASFNGSTIRYTSPNDVSVSDDASYKVFDTILSEKDNQGRAVNFPADASKEVATRLYAACVMHGAQMKNLPESLKDGLDPAALASCGLSAEDIKKIQEHFAQTQKQPGTERNAEQPQPQLSAKAREDIKTLEEIRSEFNNLKSQDVIRVVKDNDGKPKIVAGEAEEYKDKDGNTVKITPEEREQKAAEQTEKLKEAAELVKAGREANYGENNRTNEQQATDTYAYRQQQVENAKAAMTEEEVLKRELHVRNQMSRKDAIIAAKLGLLKPDEKGDMNYDTYGTFGTGENALITKLPAQKKLEINGETPKALEGEALEQYKASLKPEDLARVTEKYSPKQETTGDKKQNTNSNRNSRGGNDGR